MAYCLGDISPDAKREKIQYKNREYEIVTSTGAIQSILYRNGRALSFVPPKAHPIETFESEYSFTECIVEDWIAGPTFHLFFDGDWEIHTLTGIGGNTLSEPTSTLTLRQVFLEACSQSELDLSSLNIRKCYTFVVKSGLWMVACYEIDTENVARSVDSYGEFKGTLVRRPEHLIATTYNEAQQRFASHNCDAASAGIMIHHIPTGARTKMRNPVYELSQFNLKLQHRFFHLRSQFRAFEYLKEFPEHIASFKQLEEKVVEFTSQLHQNYLDCYVKSKNPLSWFPATHRVHLYSIHQLYLRNLRPMPITNKVVTGYVDGLHPVKLMYTMNQK